MLGQKKMEKRAVKFVLSVLKKMPVELKFLIYKYNVGDSNQWSRSLPEERIFIKDKFDTSKYWKLAKISTMKFIFKKQGSIKDFSFWGEVDLQKFLGLLGGSVGMLPRKILKT